MAQLTRSYGFLTADQPRIPLEDVATIFDGVDHTEGVASAEDGAIWCGGEEGQIYRGYLETGLEIVATVPLRPFGCAVDGEGNAFFCCSRHRSWDAAGREPVGVYRITPSGTVTFAGGDALEIPCMHANQSMFMRDGTLLFTDSGIWGSNNGRILRIDSEGVLSVAESTACHAPNGLAVSPDGNTIAVVESTLPGISLLTVDGQGPLAIGACYSSSPRPSPTASLSTTSAACSSPSGNQT